jgi:type IV fimbrial biogenesis protein FimT
MRTDGRGWSLVELLTVLSVAVVLALAAAPSLDALRYQLQVRLAVDEFASWMAMARSEAIKRRQGRVVMCPAASSAACKQLGGWGQGWLMFHDLNGNAILDAEDTVIRYQGADGRGLIVTGNTHVVRYISYTPAGRTLLVSGGLQVGTITFCHPESRAPGWRLILSATGRVRLARSTSVVC